MPYQLEWMPRGVIKKFSGTLNDAEFIAASSQVQGHAEFDNLRFVINHLVQVTQFSVSLSMLEYFFMTVCGAYHSNPNIKIAFITDDLELKQSINSLLLAHPIPYRLKFFADYSDALQWCKP